MSENKEEWIKNKKTQLIDDGMGDEEAHNKAISLYEEENNDACKKKKMDSVDRIDYYDYDPSEIFHETTEGYLTGRAAITNIGIFEYRNLDGSIRKELRPPQEVFRLDSMQSFIGKPVTNEHPPEMINADNYKKYAVGQTGSMVTDNGYQLFIDMTITDPTVIKLIKSGKTALSAGYKCDMDDTSGKEFGQNYDCIQRNITANHVAVVDRARAGDSAKIRMDSVHIISKENTMAENLNLKTIKLDGADFSAEPQVLAELNKQSVRADAAEKNAKELADQMSKLEADRDNQKERADSAVSELETLKKNHVDADKVAEMVKFRVGIEATASKANVEVKADSSDLDIMKAIVLAKKPSAKLDGKDLGYIQARYDGVVEEMLVEAEKKEDGEVRQVLGEIKNDGEDKNRKVDVNASRKKFEDAMRNSWKNKE